MANVNLGFENNLWEMADAFDEKYQELLAGGNGFEEDMDAYNEQICDTYHNWRDDNGYENIQGFCKSVGLEEVRSHEYILTPGRYVGIEEKEADSEPFDAKMGRLTAELAEMFAKSRHLEDEIRERLGAIGYEF